MSYSFVYRIIPDGGDEVSGSLIVDKMLTLEEAMTSDAVHDTLQGVAGAGYTLIKLEMPTCSGCCENQPNQLSHMDYGGCLYSEEEY